MPPTVLLKTSASLQDRELTAFLHSRLNENTINVDTIIEVDLKRISTSTNKVSIHCVQVDV